LELIKEFKYKRFTTLNGQFNVIVFFIPKLHVSVQRSTIMRLKYIHKNQFKMQFTIHRYVYVLWDPQFYSYFHFTIKIVDFCRVCICSTAARW